jgi:hypothetical protein
MVAHPELFYAVAAVTAVMYNRIASDSLGRGSRDVGERLSLARPVKLLARLFPASQVEIIQH